MIDSTTIHKAIEAAGIPVISVSDSGKIDFADSATQEQKTQAMAIATTPAMLVSKERMQAYAKCQQWWERLCVRGFNTGLNFRIPYDLERSMGLAQQYTMLKATSIQPSDPVQMWDIDGVVHEVTFSEFESIAYQFSGDRVRLSAAMATAILTIHETNDVSGMESAVATLEGVV